MKEFKSFKLILVIILIIGSSLYVNSFFVSGIVSEDMTPLIDNVLLYSENSLIDGMDSGWKAVYGSLAYNSNDYVTSNAFLIGIPTTSGSEKLRIQKTFTTPLNLLRCNIGFWIKTSGTIPTDFSFYVETYDTSNKVRQWRYYQLGPRLQGSNNVWSHHFVVSTDYSYESTIDMTRISKILFKFMVSTSNWTISIDDLRAYPNQELFPNGAVILTFDGPYEGAYNWAEPKLDQYNYTGVIATARANLVGKPTIEQHLSVLYAKGWDICVYGRLFDNIDPTKYLPAATIAENTLAEKAWLESKGFTRSSSFLHCNRHLLDVYTEDLLDDNFYFIKGGHWLASNPIAFPSLAFNGISTSFEKDMAGIEKAAATKTLYIWFNHLDQGTYTLAYTRTQFNAIVDRIHALGMEVLTYSQLLEKYTQYLYATSPHLTVQLSVNGYSVTENGVVTNFNNAEELLAYLKIRFNQWEAIP